MGFRSPRPLQSKAVLTLRGTFLILTISTALRCERRASRLFALVHEQARAAWAAGECGPSATALIWQSRYRAALVLRQAGDRKGCAAMAGSLIRAGETALPPVPIELCAAARRLLT